MLEHELRSRDEILVLRLHGSLQAEDFKSLARAVDDYLNGGGKLRGVLICGKSFPGWENLDGLIAHLKFVRNHHAVVAKVAIVADGLVARLLPSLAGHFVQARVQHFDDEETATRWLETVGAESAVA